MPTPAEALAVTALVREGYESRDASVDTRDIAKPANFPELHSSARHRALDLRVIGRTTRLRVPLLPARGGFRRCLKRTAI